MAMLHNAVLKSEDAGLNWNEVLNITDPNPYIYAVFSDVKVDPNNSQTVYATKYTKHITNGLALQYLGSIGANLELSFSDAYTGAVSALSSFLPEGTGIEAEVNVGATIGFNLKIEDDFKVFIKKNNADNYSVVINKSAASTKAGTANVAITAQLMDNDSLKLLQNSLIDSLLSEPVEKIDDIVENKPGNSISPEIECILPANGRNQEPVNGYQGSHDPGGKGCPERKGSQRVSQVVWFGGDVPQDCVRLVPPL
jgi:hypothetical protein